MGHRAIFVGLSVATILATNISSAFAVDWSELQVWIPAKDKPRGSQEDVAINLEGTLYLPEGDGPFPALVFNHGSASSTFPSSRTSKHPEVGRIFAQHGIATLIPMRRGRGASGGVVNDFATCDYPRSFAAVKHGMQDIDAAVTFVKGHSKLDGSQLFFGGQSRGAVLSSFYVGERSEINAKGVFNFAAAWMATWKCTDFAFRLFHEAGSRSKAPTFFIYGQNDRLVYKETAEENVQTFNKDGGNGTLKIYSTPWHQDGHYIANENSRAWENDVHEFLNRLGYPRISEKK